MVGKQALANPGLDKMKDITYRKTVEATAHQDPYSPFKATDGFDDTFYMSEANINAEKSFEIDFGSKMRVDYVEVVGNMAYVGNIEGFQVHILDESKNILLTISMSEFSQQGVLWTKYIEAGVIARYMKLVYPGDILVLSGFRGYRFLE
eukprot:Awhi_evm1s1267